MEDSNQNSESNLKRNSIELSLSSVKEFLLSKGGKCKYSEIFNHYRDLISDSGLGKFNFIHIFF